ncbi:hypothetical protein ARMSODRAFT_439941 [Armillaria solidipes]|uniref:Uncharacterized protein n=1 Tax=Armillaria solidipes TaxID=1076256 RepID=A0A2H3BGV0_9AGAR|nr:hypothetical protein ARMSODRAFT_439941 [Armillaria solidipes]
MRPFSRPSGCSLASPTRGTTLSSHGSSTSDGSTTHFSTFSFSCPCVVTFASRNPANPHPRTLHPAFELVAMMISLPMAKHVITGPRSGRVVAGRRGAPRVSALVTTAICCAHVAVDQTYAAFTMRSKMTFFFHNVYNRAVYTWVLSLMWTAPRS